MSGFGDGFRNVVKKTNGADLGAAIVSGGGGKYLDGGTHDVRVAGIDRNLLSQNKLTIKWEDAKGKEHNDMLYPMETNKKTGESEINWKFAAVLGMLIPTTEAYDAFLQEVANDNAAVLDMFVGMKGRIILARLKGYGPAEDLPDGTFMVRDVKNAENFYVGASIAEAQEAAEAAGLKKAYLNVSKYIATSGEDNIKKFSAALAAHHSKPAAAAPRQGYRTAV